MNPPREPGAIVAAWLEEGPNELPESTRRAIAVDVRTTRQSRRSSRVLWRIPPMDRSQLLAMGAVAVVALVVGALVTPPFASDGNSIGGIPPSESTSPPSPIPTTLAIPPMQRTFFSERHGYTVSYPADWVATGAADPGGWSPPEWQAGGSDLDPFDVVSMTEVGPWFRSASAQLPADLPDVDGWIDQYLTYSSVPDCAPPREEWEAILIDGAPGRLRDSCGEVEATVVLDGRVYLFTLFLGESQIANGRALFDALASTIDLRPEDAVRPSPSPSTSPEVLSVGARFSRGTPQVRAG